MRTVSGHYILPGLLFALCLITGCKRKPNAPGVVHRNGEPDVINVESEDTEMNAAIAEARRTKTAFLQVLNAPKKNQTDFSAKRPYPTKNGSDNEHIWISHLSYDGHFLHGTVGDEPVNIPNLKLDEFVSFSPEELSDWMYLENGEVVGGYTIRVLRQRMSPKEGAEFDQHLRFKP